MQTLILEKERRALGGGRSDGGYSGFTTPRRKNTGSDGGSGGNTPRGGFTPRQDGGGSGGNTPGGRSPGGGGNTPGGGGNTPIGHGRRLRHVSPSQHYPHCVPRRPARLFAIRT